MSTRLIILGLLQERSLHGYEIKHIIETRMGDWTSIAFGSIYFALKKLTDEGLLQIETAEQQGNRPSRTIYGITDEGRAMFLHLLRSLWETPERHYYKMDVGLFFMDALPNSEIVAYLHERIEKTDNTLQYLEKHRSTSMANPQVPRRARWIFGHSQRHLEAELSWLKSLLVEFESGQAQNEIAEQINTWAEEA